MTSCPLTVPTACFPSGRVDVCVQGGGLQLDPAAAAAGDGMSLPGICPRPHQRLGGSEKLGENSPGRRNPRQTEWIFVFGRAFSAACSGMSQGQTVPPRQPRPMTMFLRIDRQIAGRPLGVLLEHRRRRQQALVVIGQTNDFTQMIRPAFHRPDLDPPLGMRDVVYSRQNTAPARPRT